MSGLHLTHGGGVKEIVFHTPQNPWDTSSQVCWAAVVSAPSRLPCARQTTQPTGVAGSDPGLFPPAELS